ncbi:MAG: outer membrane protein transport protein [Pseudomonadota bacterium]|nr:outer membrane protein transport protein [Pseudomonadota bacterium]
MRLVELDYPVNNYITAVREDRHLDIPLPAKTYIAVCRSNYKPWRVDLEPQRYALLSCLQQGKSLGEALESSISADSSWTNPAGMTGLQQDEMLAGMQVLVPKIEFDSSVAEAGGSDGGNAGNIAAIPAFFMVKKLSDRVRLGFSLVAPQGSAMSYSDNFVGRYGATKVSLAAIGGSPSIAYKQRSAVRWTW